MSAPFSVEMVTVLVLTSPSQGDQAIYRGEGNRAIILYGGKKSHSLKMFGLIVETE